MNNVVLIGRLVKDPEMRNTGQNTVANFTLAIDKGLSKSKKQEFEAQGKPTADFPRITVWGKQAENCMKYLAKGRLVAIQGSIQTGSYKDQQGQTRYTTDVLAQRVEFLEWGEPKQDMDTNFSTSHIDDDFSFHDDDYQALEDDDDVPF